MVGSRSLWTKSSVFERPRSGLSYTATVITCKNGTEARAVPVEHVDVADTRINRSRTASPPPLGVRAYFSAKSFRFATVSAEPRCRTRFYFARKRHLIRLRVWRTMMKRAVFSNVDRNDCRKTDVTTTRRFAAHLFRRPHNSNVSEKNLIKWVECTVSPPHSSPPHLTTPTTAFCLFRVPLPRVKSPQSDFAARRQSGLRIVVFDLFVYKPVLIGFFRPFSRFRRRTTGSTATRSFSPTFERKSPSRLRLAGDEVPAFTTLWNTSFASYPLFKCIQIMSSVRRSDWNYFQT